MKVTFITVDWIGCAHVTFAIYFSSINKIKKETLTLTNNADRGY